MAHHGSGVVLKTSFEQKENKVLRVVFDKKYISYRTITDYVPPIFLVINYEETAFDRDCFVMDSTTTGPRIDALKNVLENNNNNCQTEPSVKIKTDEVFRDNVRFVESLLVAAECGYDACQVTFLRLETAGDFQRTFDKLYPLWNVGVGALVRLSFSTWLDRTRALKVLATNAANNRDVYTIHFAANTNPVTLVDYLEPLFAYCVRRTKADGHDTDCCTRLAGSLNAAKKASHATAAANTTEMFEINFCIIDEQPVGRYKSIGDDIARSTVYKDNASAVSSAAGTTTSKKSGPKKREASTSRANVSGGTQADIAADHGDFIRPKKPRRGSAVLEKQRSVSGSLSVHDVRPYFSMLNSRRLTRISLEQLEELPVVTVHCERFFCSTTCCIVDRTDNCLTTLHVYYCWDKQVHEFLSTFAEAHNNRGMTTEHTMVAVSPLCSEDVEARLNMLQDLKNVIWKDNMNAYVRLAISDSHDENMLARNFYEPLVLRVQRSTADLETEIKRSVATSRPSGTTDMFRNAITLDCSRLCTDLDPKTCRFTRAHHELLNDPSLTCNGYVRLDGQTLCGSAVVKQNAIRLLERGQEYRGRLVSTFRSERILDAAFDMASELRLGLLDVFGLRYTERRSPSKTYARNDPLGGESKNTSEDHAFGALAVSNMVFLDTLLDSSQFTGVCSSVSQYNEFFTKEKNVKPLAHSVRGLYRHDVMEFDLQSAYPTITALYNISPETTAIVERHVLKRLDETLNAFIIDDAGHPQQQPMRTSNVMTLFYNQIGHVNEVDSNLVVVSLRSEIHVGFLARVMERLVLKRRSRNQLLNPFYKKLANIVYGCTGRASAFNDLFSPQCASAIRSMCKTIMTRTLEILPMEYVILTQTDGALFYTGPRDGEDELEFCSNVSARMTSKDVETIVRGSINNILSEVGNITSSVTLVPRLRPVDLCLLVDQNRYLITYSDGKTVCKGQDFTTAACPRDSRTTNSLLATISKYLRDDFDTGGNAAVELNKLLTICFTHLKTLNEDGRTEWSIKIRTPSSKEILFDEANQLSLIGISLSIFSTDECRKQIVDTSVARFGDTVVVWPVLVNDNGEVFNEFRVTRPLYNVAVRPNYVFVTKNLLWFWVKWLFAICLPTMDEAHVTRMFYAVCKKYEQQMLDA